jgi:hypothetical protein
MSDFGGYPSEILPNVCRDLVAGSELPSEERPRGGAAQRELKGARRKMAVGGEMSDFYVNLYRVLVAALAILVFFMSTRPYFDAKLRILMSALCAGILNGFVGAASLGTSLDGIPLRFIIGFVVVGAGVGLLEYIFPQGGRSRKVRP